MRKNLSENEECAVNYPKLDELIPQYAHNKDELSNIKSICDSQNEEIKRQLLEKKVDSYTAGDYTAKRSVETRETLDEEKLLMVIKKHNIPGVIITKECVDMDAFENYMYKNSLDISSELASDLNSCRNTTEIVKLRISKAKKKKEE